MTIAQCHQLESLSRRGVITLQAQAGTTIESKTGTVWITQDRDATDHVIGAGESVTFDRDGKLVLYAFDPALVCIDTPRAAARRSASRRIGSGARATAPAGFNAHPVRARLARWLGALVGA